MRAWQVGAHGEPVDALTPVELPSPEVGEGLVRIRVRAAALGLPDVFMCRGTYPLTPALPFTPGQEVCGSLDDGTRVMAITDFVHGHGGFAEETVANVDNVFDVPDAFDDAQAAGFLIAFQTAWIALRERAALTAGEDLLVLGAAGGSGAAAVQLGAALGARVIAVASGPDRTAWCRELGADTVVDRTREELRDAVAAATGGRGAAVVFDPVGGPLALDAMRVTAKGGRFLLVGFASGEWPRIDAARAVMGNYSVMGVYAGAYDRSQKLHMVEAMSALDLVPSVTPVAFAALPSALATVADGTSLGRPVALLS